MKLFGFVIFLLFSTSANGADVDGFDFPVGYPDGAGWNNGSNCVAASCSDGSCLEGLDFLEPHNYGGSIGCILHPGEDWNKDGGGDCGQNIHATANGQVVALPGGCSWGTLVIRHDGVPGYGTLWSVYGHMSSASVSINQWLTRGQIIGTVDAKGAASCHLHFEIRKSNLSACYFPTAGGGGAGVAWVTDRYLDPTEYINNNRPGNSYYCQFDSQSPNSVFWTRPGEVRSYWVKYTNEGTASWVNSGGVGVENYVELWSCNSSGTIVNSWFEPEPPDWINGTNRQRVTSCDEVSVAAGGGIATFSFLAETPVVATVENLPIYFRPTHGGQTMDDWGGMHFLVSVDANNPTTPASVTATPSTNSSNSFSFNWSASSDAHSGMSGYYWKINSGGETFTSGTSVSAGSYAPSDGTHMFYVRAVDNVGNSSGSGSATFTLTSGPCGVFITGSCGSASEEWADMEGNQAAVYEDYVIKLNPHSTNDWATIGQDATLLFKPDRQYRLGFWYRTFHATPFSWGLSRPAGELAGENPVMMTVAHPTADGEWHQYSSAPFSVTAGQISEYPILTFQKGAGNTGLVEVLEVQLYDAIEMSEARPSVNQNGK